jgi:hypothetical protein
MLEIDGFILPEEIEKALSEIIDKLSDSVIKDFVRKHKGLAKGYQVKKKNAGTFRNRIKKQLATGSELVPDILEMLRANYRFSNQFGKLSVRFLNAQFIPLLAIIKPYELAVIYLLDNREVVRKTSINAIKDGIISDEDLSVKNAKLDIAEFIKEFIPLSMFINDLVDIGSDIINSVTDDEGIDNTDIGDDGDITEDDEDSPYDKVFEAYEAKIEQLSETIQKQKIELSQYKEYEKKNRKLTRAAQENNEKIQCLKRDLKNNRSEYKQLSIKLKKVEAELGEKQETLSGNIKSGIESEISAHIHDWLQRPEEIKCTVEKLPKNGGVLELAEAALKKQAQRDKHSGNIRILREQLDKLTHARDKIILARTEALSPIAELETAENKLTEEISELHELLGNSNMSAFATMLAAEINKAEDEKALIDIMERLGAFSDMNLLPDNEMRQLYSGYHAKTGQLYDRLLIKFPSAAKPQTLAWQFKYALDKQQPFIWILDGHNVLFGLKDIFGSDDNGVPGEAARNNLITTMTEMVKDAPQCEVNIFFDGPVYSQEHSATNVKIIYSGGKGEHRADNVILELAEYMQLQSPDIMRVLVTNDHDLACGAEKHKVASMSLFEFAAIIMNFR